MSAFRRVGETADHAHSVARRGSLNVLSLRLFIRQQHRLHAARTAGPALRETLTVNGRRFEELTADAFTRLGWLTDTTKASGDFGADVIASFGGNKLVIQCKDWKGKAGVEAVHQAHGAKSHYKADMALVVARSGFTANARQLAATTGVRLFLLEQLVQGCEFDKSEEWNALQREWARKEQAQREEKLRAERERAENERWATYRQARLAYDRRLKVYGHRWSSLAVLAAAAVVIALSFGHREPFIATIATGLFLLASHWALFVKANPGEPPMPPADGAARVVVNCSHCGLGLRLPRGRQGRVRCAACGSEFEAAT